MAFPSRGSRMKSSLKEPGTTRERSVRFGENTYHSSPQRNNVLSPLNGEFRVQGSQIKGGGDLEWEGRQRQGSKINGEQEYQASEQPPGGNLQNFKGYGARIGFNINSASRARPMSAQPSSGSVNPALRQRPATAGAQRGYDQFRPPTQRPIEYGMPPDGYVGRENSPNENVRQQHPDNGWTSPPRARDDGPPPRVDVRNLPGSPMRKLGVAVSNSQWIGVEVTAVESSGPAGVAGLLRGDMVEAVNSRAVTNIVAFRKELDSVFRGTAPTLLLEVRRGQYRSKKTIQILLSALPPARAQSPSRPHSAPVTRRQQAPEQAPVPHTFRGGRASGEVMADARGGREVMADARGGREVMADAREIYQPPGPAPSAEQGLAAMTARERYNEHQVTTARERFQQQRGGGGGRLHPPMSQQPHEGAGLRQADEASEEYAFRAGGPGVGDGYCALDDEQLPRGQMSARVGVPDGRGTPAGPKNVLGEPYYLGMSLAESPAGVRVTDVRARGPAANGGLQTNDVITHVADRPVPNMPAFAALMQHVGIAGVILPMDVTRGRQRTACNLRVGFP